MAIKSADPQTIAPRLSIVEDQAAWLLENRGQGGGGGTDPSELLKKLYQSTVGLSHTSSAAPDDEIWDENVYADDNGERSMHVALFGWSAERKDHECGDLLPEREGLLQHDLRGRRRTVAGLLRVTCE